MTGFQKCYEKVFQCRRLIDNLLNGKKLTLVGRAGNTRFACHGIEAFQEEGVCSDSHILLELFQNRLGH